MLWTMLLLVAALAMTSCERGGDEEEEGSGEGAEEEAVPVEVASVTLGEVTDVILATATLTSEREVTVMAMSVGDLVDLDVDEGDVVTVGQKIGRIQNSELSISVDRARSQVRRTKAEVDRLRPLDEKGYIPHAEFQRAETEWEIAKEELSRARSLASDTVLESPAAGVVAVRHVEKGAAVAGSQPIVTIVDVDELQADVQVPERALGTLRVGQAATVVPEALPDESFPATVQAIAPIVDPTTGTVKVELELDQIETDDGTRLRPGMFIEARIVTETRSDVPLVPKRALLFEDTRPYVFVARADRARLLWIETGTNAGDRVEVRSGLEADDDVVVLGQAALKDDAPIDVIRRDGGPAKTAAKADAPGSDLAPGAADEAGSAAPGTDSDAPSEPAPSAAPATDDDKGSDEDGSDDPS